MCWLFASGGQSIGVSASASVLPMNTQDWSPLGWTGWISLQSTVLSRGFSNTTVQKHQFFGAQSSLWSNSHMVFAFLWLTLLSMIISRDLIFHPKNVYAALEGKLFHLPGDLSPLTEVAPHTHPRSFCFGWVPHSGVWALSYFGAFLQRLLLLHCLETDLRSSLKDRFLQKPSLGTASPTPDPLETVLWHPDPLRHNSCFLPSLLDYLLLAIESEIPMVALCPPCVTPGP